MADPRFFRVQGSLTLEELAGIAGAELTSDADGKREFEGVAPLSRAGARDVSFLDNPRYLEEFKASRAGACVVSGVHAALAPAGMALLVTDRPYRGYARIANAFYPAAEPDGTISPAAHVHETAQLGQGTTVAPGAVIGANARIGSGCEIGANSVIGESVEIGDGTRIGANASLSHCLIGNRVQIHPGVRIGQRGFGFDMSEFPYLDVPQLGRVLVEDDVEIGANTTIDRGAGPDTVIGAGSKLDNLIQIGHNVRIGRGCVLVAQSGVAGSSNLEDHAVVAAQAGVGGHLQIGARAQIAAASAVMRDVPAGAKVAGTPAMPVKEFFRLVAMWRRSLRTKGD